MNTKIVNEIKVAEKQYYACFCSKEEHSSYIKYTDNTMKDMYMHNFLSLEECAKDDLEKIINKEASLSRKKGAGFLRIASPFYIEDGDFHIHPKDISRETEGVYIFDDFSRLEMSPLKKHNIVKKVGSKEQIEDAIKIDLDDENLPEFSKDFRKRKLKASLCVYKKNPFIDLYIVYDEKNEPCSFCEYMKTDTDVVKIENVVTAFSKRRMGNCAFMLSYLIDKAREDGVKFIYLIADEEDTPKNMYINMGFQKLYTQYAMKFSL